MTKPARRLPIVRIDPNEVLQKPIILAQELYDAHVLPLSLNGIYRAMASGEIECINLGS